MINITQKQLDVIWNALAYTSATISNMSRDSKERENWILIHKGRAYQSKVFMENAIKLVNELRSEKE